MNVFLEILPRIEKLYGSTGRWIGDESRMHLRIWVNDNTMQL